VLRPPASTRKRGSETVRDMVLSLGLLLLVTLVLFALVAWPRHHPDPVKTVDYSAQLQVFSREAPYPVLAPEGLPPYWRATSFTVGVPASDQASLHIGFVVDQSPRTYAAVEQSNEPTAAFVRRLKLPPVTGSTVIAARTWQVRTDGAGHTSLSRPSAGGAFVVVTDGGGAGGATRPQLTELAGSLVLQPR
jgi:Protein of unknown function (DUF4245)